jgi:hypothetical protein
MSLPDPIAEHERCSNHRAAVLSADLVGCFYCLAIYPPTEILDWVDGDDDDLDNGKTALCGKCGIDSVIPIREGIDRAFLQAMHDHWF